MIINPRDNATMVAWYTKAGRDDLLSRFEVSGDALAEQLLRATRLHPRYTNDERMAWAVYNLSPARERMPSQESSATSGIAEEPRQIPCRFVPAGPTAQGSGFWLWAWRIAILGLLIAWAAGLHAQVTTVIGTRSGNAVGIICDSGCGGAAAFEDQDAVTPGTTPTNLVGGFRDDAAPSTLSEGQGGLVRITEFRALHVHLLDASGNPLTLMSLGAKYAAAVAIVDGAGNQITSFGGGTQYTEADLDTTITGTAIMFESNTGTSALSVVNNTTPLPVSDAGGALTIDGTLTAVTSITNAVAVTGTFWQATQPVSGTFWQATQPISAASLPLPSGASTAANQTSVIGTDGLAGPASVLSVGGTQSTGEIQEVQVDADGQLQVDVLTMPTVTVTDGAGAMNVIVDSGTLTAITTITNSVTVTDGAGALNVICDSGCAGGAQYTEADIDATITGTATMMEVAADTLQPIQGTVAGGLLVNLGTNNDVTVTGTVTADAGTGTFVVGDGAGALNVICDSGCSGGTQYTDDTSTHSTGVTLGTAMVAAATPTDAAVDANDLGVVGMSTDRRLFTDTQIVGQDATLTVGDGAGALNTIVDSGTLTAVTTITNSVTVTDGAGALNVICDSGCAGGVQYTEADTDVSITGTALMMEGAGDALVAAPGTAADGLLVNLGTNNDVVATATNLDIRDLTATDVVTVTDGVGALNVIVDSGTVTANAGTGTFVVGDGAGALNVICDSGCGAGTEYTEAATDASITGTAILMEGAADTLLPVQGTVTDGLLVNLGTNNDVVASATDLDIRNLTATDVVTVTDGAGALNVIVDSGTVTAVTSITNSVAVTAAAGAATIAKAEDAASVDLDVGVQMLAIRDDTLNVRSGAENDYEPLHTDANGALWVIPSGTTVVGDGAGALNVIVDSGTTTVTQATGTNLHAVIDTGSTTAATQATASNLNATVVGTGTFSVQTSAQIPGTGATNLGKAEDVASASGDTLVAAGCVTNDADGTAFASNGTDGDYAVHACDKYGAVMVTGQHPTQWSYHENSSSALTDTTVHAACAAGEYNYIGTLAFSSGAATQMTLMIEDSTTTAILGPYYLEAVSGRGAVINFNPPKKQTTSATLISVTTTGAIAHSVDITGFCSR